MPAQRKAPAIILCLLCASLWTALFFIGTPRATVYAPDMSLKTFAQRNGLKPGRIKAEIGHAQVPGRTTMRELGVSETQAAALVSHVRGDVASGTIALMLLLCAAWVLTAVVLLHRGRMTAAAKCSLLIAAVAVFGFAFGKTANPMVAMVKAAKAVAGISSSLTAWLLVAVIFCLLSVVGAKAVCGWACPFGALQELFFKIPLLSRWKKKHPVPFLLTNTIRIGLFVVFVAALWYNLFGLSARGRAIYHFMNPFQLFALQFPLVPIGLYIALALGLSIIVYRPHCYLVCPFGLLSWVLERISLYRVRIDRNVCTGCGACIIACPGPAMQGLYEDRRLAPDCFSCGECLRVCPVGALTYSTESDTDCQPGSTTTAAQGHQSQCTN